MEATSLDRRKAMGVALCRAVLCWIVVYVVVAHVYMLWTWPAAAEPVVTETKQQTTIPKGDKDMDDDTKARQVLTKTAQRLERELRQAEKEQAQWVDATNQKVSLMQHNLHEMQSLETKLPKRQETQVKLPQLQKLLGQSNLEHLTDKELRTAISKSAKEIASVLSQQHSVAWEGWTSILGSNADYPREAPLPKKCSNGGDSISTDTSRLSDLYLRVQKVEAAMSKRKSASTTTSPLTNESSERVNAAIQRTIVQSIAQDSREDTTTDPDNDNDMDKNGCVDPDQVEWLVEEGLNALQRHKDLRMVLQRALSHLDEEAARTVILDAILPPKNSDASTPNNDNTNDNINLRHVLDTPLVSQKSPAWLDVAVDHVSGHVDMVDNSLDSMLSDSHHDSVGKILVSKTLDLAGHVCLPNPFSQIETKAGLLRP